MKNTMALNFGSDFSVGDEPQGDLADSARAFEELYRAHALFAVLCASPRHRRRRNRKKRYCELCRQEIPMERLNVLPGATRCVACQRGMEEKHRMRRRTASHYYE